MAKLDEDRGQVVYLCDDNVKGSRREHLRYLHKYCT